MSLLIDYGGLSSQDITGNGIDVVTHTLTNYRRVGVSLFLSNLDDSVAANITMTVETLDGSNNSFGIVSEVFSKATEQTRLRLDFDPALFGIAGYKVKVRLGSTGSNNTSVNCDWFLFDVNRVNDEVTAAAIADAVWEESLGDHSSTSGSTAEAMTETFVRADDARTFSQAVLDDTGTSGVVVADGSKSGYTLATTHDVYHADVDLTVDGLDTRDEYTITWFKNGVRLTSGITNPEIQVVRRDGDDLIEEMTPDPGAIGATGSFAHNAEEDRIEPGEAVLVIVSATIDGATRSFAKLVSRDAEA